MFARGAGRGQIIKTQEAMATNLLEDTPLYRIIPLERFLQMLQSRKNTLVSPSLWEDPFEILLDRDLMDKISSKGPIPDDAPIQTLNYEGWYAQCWSRIKESDSLWKVFTHGEKQRCVKIETTVGKLLDSTKGIPIDVRIILDKVLYGDIEDGSFLKKVEKHFEHNERFMDEPQLYITSLLFTKRSAFQYEEEVRLLAYVPNHVRAAKVYEYDIDPFSLITKVILDPWTPQESIKAVTTAINAFVPTKKSSNMFKVEPSLLYDKKKQNKKFIESIYEPNQSLNQINYN